LPRCVRCVAEYGGLLEGGPLPRTRGYHPHTPKYGSLQALACIATYPQSLSDLGEFYLSFGENLSGDDDRAEENLDTVGHRIFLLRAALGCECSACSNSLSQEDTVIPENKWPYGLLSNSFTGERVEATIV